MLSRKRAAALVIAGLMAGGAAIGVVANQSQSPKSLQAVSLASWWHWRRGPAWWVAAAAAHPATAGASQPLPTPKLPGGPMHLIFDDEFNGTGDHLSNRWENCFLSSLNGCSNWDNEGEWYLPQNISVSDGSLHLTAKRQTVTGRNMDTGRPEIYHYTSGMVTSYSHFYFKYGYVEWSAKLVSGQGFWPALWLLPEQNVWPPEVDALETVGDAPDVACWTYHPPTGNAEAWDANIPGLTDGYHTFGVDWEPGRITWYVDGKREFTATRDVTADPLYLVMNLAVGGTWPGFPNASTPFPTSFDINYVRVWQH